MKPWAHSQSEYAWNLPELAQQRLWELNYSVDHHGRCASGENQNSTAKSLKTKLTLDLSPQKPGQDLKSNSAGCFLKKKKKKSHSPEDFNWTWNLITQYSKGQEAIQNSLTYKELGKVKQLKGKGNQQIPTLKWLPKLELSNKIKQQQKNYGSYYNHTPWRANNLETNGMTDILMKETEPTEEELKENSIAEKYSNRNFKVHQTQ